MLESERQIRHLMDAHQRREMGVEHDYYGDHWGTFENNGWMRKVRDDYLKECRGEAIEIGSGGGRWTVELLKRATTVVAVDGTFASLDLLKMRFSGNFKLNGGLVFQKCEDGILHFRPQSFDFAFSYDTFVHFHPRLFNAYLCTLSFVLCRGAYFVLHYACDLDPRDPYDPVCFQYVSKPEFARLVGLHGFDIKDSFDIRGSGLSSVVALLRRT